MQPAALEDASKPAKSLKVVAAAAPVASEPEQLVAAEIAKFEAIAGGVLAEGDRSRFFDKKARLFDQKAFWYEHRFDLPIHYRTFVGQVGSAKAASANVETVFSGIGGMLAKAPTMDPELASNYTILHYNFSYDFLEPTDEEVVAAYTKVNGEEEPEFEDGNDSDDSDDSDEGSDNDEDDADADDAADADDLDAAAA